MPENNDWIIDIQREQEWHNCPKVASQSHLVATIELAHTFFELLLKDGFAVLYHPHMKERLFVQTMSIIEILSEFFGDIIVTPDIDSIYIPVLYKPFCHIKIE